VVGHDKFPFVSYYDLRVESFSLFPVIEFGNGFLPLLAHSSNTTKDNFKLTRIMLDLSSHSRIDKDRILVGRYAVLSGK